MFPDAVLNVLVADNPWLEGEDVSSWIGTHLPEDYIERRREVALDDRVALITGPRQAGKSTLIWKTLSRSDSPCLLVNCEEPSIRGWSKSPALFVEGLGRLVPPGAAVFFEEVQHLEEAGLFLKGLADRKTGYRFIATGSSSFELESRTRESLAGRANRHLLLPFSTDELMAGYEGALALEARRRLEIMDDLMIHGGYPSVHLGENRQAILTGLVESFVVRDASDRFRIRHTDAFRKLLELMASQIGNLVNYSEWASNTGISADTVRDYATILEDAHVVRFVRPFVGGKRAEITSTPKVYFVDNGVRNRLFGGFSAVRGRSDKGALMENFVFSEIAKNTNSLLDGIGFWRSKSGAEVDFVVPCCEEIIGIEVKTGNTRGRLSRSAHSFVDAYAPARFLVVGDTGHEGFMENGTRVDFVSLPDLLGNLFPT